MFKNERKSFAVNLCAILVLLTMILGITGFSEADGTTNGGGSGSDNFIFTGAATYSVPISVPPGRLELAPKLALNYNSQLGSGWLGAGWTLDLGSIQRNTTYGVNYANNYANNAFVYTEDGSSKALVYVGGTEFRTQIEDGSFMRFYLETSPSDGNLRWRVLDKDGKTYLFGDTTASRQDNLQGNSYSIFKWCLDNVQDANSNYMTVSYFKDQGEIYLQQINYTGNSSTGLSTTNYVSFELENRTDTVMMLNSNYPVLTTHRLQNIYVYANNQLARQYSMNYSYSNNTSRSLLTSVTQYGSDGITALPPVTFTYAGGSDGFTSNFSGPALSDANGFSNPIYYSTIQFPDLNGDGIPDLCYRDSQGISCWLGTGTGFTSNFRGPALSDANGFNNPIYYSTIQYPDLNGDGMADICYRDAMGISCWIGTGSGFTSNFRGPALSDAGGFNNPIYYSTIQYPDVNGDGMADICYRDAMGISCWIGTGSGFTSNFRGPALSDAGGFNNPIYYSTIQYPDLNGDGMADICYRDAIGISCWIGTGSGFTSNFRGPALSDAGGFNNPIYYSTIQYPDVNGDGMADICYRDAIGISCWIGTGSGFTSNFRGPALSDAGGFNNPIYYSTIQYPDVNGDGMADICYRDAMGISCWIGTGSSFTSNFRGPALSDAGGFNNPIYYSTIQYPKTNGDGKADICYRGSQGMYCSNSPHDGTEALQAISNGLGGTTTISYKPSSVYTNNHPLPFVVQTVSSIAVNDGFGNISTTNYAYSGGYYDYPTREFRGFEYVTQTNPDGTTLQTWFYQGNSHATGDNADYKGQPRQTLFKDPNSNLLNETDYAWTETVTNGSAFIQLTDKYSTNYIGGIPLTTLTYSAYDAQGNLSTRTSSDISPCTFSSYTATPPTCAPYATNAESITTSNLYANYGTWLWRVTDTTVTGTASGKIRETIYAYYANGNIKSKTFWLNGGTYPQISMTYWPEGNLETSTDANGNTTTISYDKTTSTYPYQITNPLNQVTTSQYDYRYGAAQSTVDQNSNTTANVFDPFGRVTQQTVYNGGVTGSIVTQALKVYYDSSFPRYIQSSVLESINGGVAQYITQFDGYDGLDRKIQTITYGQNNNEIVSQVMYDNMGRPYFSWGPFYYPQPSSYPYTQTSYDYFGHPVAIQTPDVQYGTVTTQISYSGLPTTSGLSTTVTDPDGKSKTETKDYLGRIIEVQEYGNNNAIYTTLSTYNAAGNLLTVKDTNGNLTTITYDTLGRKTTMTDPDMGVWQYAYDNNGNMTQQIDAKTQYINFTYDPLNRISSKTYTTTCDPTVTYIYDNPATNANGIGRLYTVSNAKATTTYAKTTYNAYDATGKVASVSESINGAPSNSYTTLTQYDYSGKPIQMTYPDSYYVTYSYYPGSALLESVTGSDGTVYATNSNYQPTGKIGQITYGNNTVAQYTYDVWSTKLLGIVATTPNSTTNPATQIINRGYQYSMAGDMLTITDYVQGAKSGLPNNALQYQYTYDNLHRLTSESTTNGTYQPQSTTYDPTGNILTNIFTNSTGNISLAYQYNNTSHVHAVSAITANGTQYNFTYDANGNMTTGYDLTNPTNVVSRTITYNADNKPVSINYGGTGGTVSTFIYDGNGGRVTKVSPSGTTFYVGQHFEVINGVNTKYIFAGNIRIAKVVTPTQIYYYHGDHLGSAAAMTDISANIVETSNYLPYGGMRVHTGAIESNYKFTDQELDPETGLYYYGARYYDPTIGRFISPDTVVPNFRNPQSFNRYSYCGNNPLIYTDPSGHFRLDFGKFFGHVEKAIEKHWEVIASVAISAVAFYAAGALIAFENAAYLEEATEECVFNGVPVAATINYVGPVSMAAIHAAAGALAGGLSAAINRSNVGLGMLTGAISAGVAKFAGGFIENEAWGYQLAGRSAIGATTGGITSDIYGQGFEKGFVRGGETAAAAFIFNDLDLLHGHTPTMDDGNGGSGCGSSLLCWQNVAGDDTPKIDWKQTLEMWRNAAVELLQTVADSKGKPTYRIQSPEEWQKQYMSPCVDCHSGE